jgi:hypothetical protein
MQSIFSQRICLPLSHLFLHFILAILLMLDPKPHFMSFGSLWIQFGVTLYVYCPRLELSAAVVVGRWWWCSWSCGYLDVELTSPLWTASVTGCCKSPIQCGGFLHWTTDSVSFYVCLGREFAPKTNMECIFSLLLQSLLLVWQLCMYPLFYAPWQHFDGSRKSCPLTGRLSSCPLCLVCAQCIAWLSRSQP